MNTPKAIKPKTIDIAMTPIKMMTTIPIIKVPTPSFRDSLEILDV